MQEKMRPVEIKDHHEGTDNVTGDLESICRCSFCTVREVDLDDVDGRKTNKL